jgi:hypothetical protein
MEKIISEYERLINKLYSEKGNYPEDDLVIFTPAKGSTYNTELMVIGRAVNDWKNYLSKHDNSNKLSILKGVKDCLETDGLEWVEGSWGTTTEGEYNTKKSAFWRVVKALAIEFADRKEGAIYNIVWSNLYKVAKSGGGNPSELLKSVQFEHCLNLLKFELELFKPKYVIFLTNYYGWAEPFVKGLGITKRTRSDAGFIRFTGVYNGSNIVVAQHPQGKPEEQHIQEIMEANETFK